MKNNTMSPVPAPAIAPGEGGPVRYPNKNDVLCGRGGRINAHEGNVRFRELVKSVKMQYLSKRTKKMDKAHRAANIVAQVRSLDPPGRFLKEDAKTGMWLDIGDERARKKAGQALREDAPDIREEMQTDVNNDGMAVLTAAAGAQQVALSPFILPPYYGQMGQQMPAHHPMQDLIPNQQQPPTNAPMFFPLPLHQFPNLPMAPMPSHAANPTNFHQFRPPMFPPGYVFSEQQRQQFPMPFNNAAMPHSMPQSMTGEQFKQMMPSFTHREMKKCNKNKS